MNILLTNDDGFFAPGIQSLKQFLEADGHSVTIVAPNEEQSAKSSAITLFQPLRIFQKEENVFAVTGTPVDAVILGHKSVLDYKPDLVISGTNGGQNLGQDVLYSGTVGAALEAMNLGSKAIAVSIASYKNQKFETASKFICNLLKTDFVQNMSKEEIININVPDIAYEDLKGVKITRTGKRKFEDFVHKQQDPRGNSLFWIGGNNVVWDESEGTDYCAIKNDFISITPIRPDFNLLQRHKELRFAEDFVL